jgi:hypothetical protein
MTAWATTQSQYLIRQDDRMDVRDMITSLTQLNHGLAT